MKLTSYTINGEAWELNKDCPHSANLLGENPSLKFEETESENYTNITSIKNLLKLGEHTGKNYKL